MTAQQKECRLDVCHCRRHQAKTSNMAADLVGFAFAVDIPLFHRAQREYRRKRHIRSFLRFLVTC